MATYDVGRIVVEAQAIFFPRTMVEKGSLQAIVNDPASASNLATPSNLLVLLDALHEVTELVNDPLHRELAVGAFSQRDWLDYQAWRDRLTAYTDAANEAHSDDKSEVFESVTAPLLMGLFPGEGGSRMPDMAEPFRFANRTGMGRAERREALAGFFGSVVENAADLPADAGEVMEHLGSMLAKAGKVMLYVLGAAVGAFALWKVSK